MLIYGLGSTLNQALQFLLLPLFTAYLSPRDYGIIGMLGFMSLIITPVFSLGFGTAIGVCYYDSTDPRKRQQTICTAVGLLALSAGVLAGIALVFQRQISLLVFQSEQEHHLIVLSLLTNGLLILTQPWQVALQFEEKAVALQTLNLLSTLASIGLDVLFIIILRKGVTGWVVSSLLGQAVTLSFFLGYTFPRLKFRFSRTRAKELLQLGIPMVPSFASVFVLMQGNRYLIKRILPGQPGLAAVGLYTLGFNLGLAMSLVVSAFTMAWTPYFMSYIERREEARILFGRIMTYYVLGVGTVSLLFYIAARPVVMVMTKPAFHGAYIIVGPSATAQMLTGVFSLLLPAVYFAKEVKHILIVQLLSALISVGANSWLISRFGLMGAGIGLILGVLCMDILFYFRNRLRRDYLVVDYQWRRILRFAGVYVAYVLGMLWPRNLSLVQEILFSSTATLLLFSILFLFLEDGEKRALRTLWQRLR
jgi:O-antigen/teichoic acid export membrane protein